MNSSEPIVEPGLPSADQPSAGASPTSGGVSPIAAGLIAMLASVLSVGAYHLAIAPRPTRIAVVDLPAIYREKEAAFERALTREGATDGEREAAMVKAREFARQLPRVLDELAQECACTVLAANAVAGRYNAIDLTQALRGKVAP